MSTAQRKIHGDDVLAVQQQMRHRGLRWLLRHGHLDGTAVHILDTPEHAGGWSVDASVNLPAWDRQGLERLVRYCARPPLSQERLGRLNDETLVYRLRKPTVDGRMELILTLLELLDRLSKLVTPPRLHKHRYCGVLAPNAQLRKSVIQSAGPAGATLLLVRIYECLPLLCPRCNRPMRILAFIQDPPVIEKILHHIDEPTQPPKVLPARAGAELPSRLKKREWERGMRVTDARDPIRAGTRLPRKGGWIYYPSQFLRNDFGDPTCPSFSPNPFFSPRFAGCEPPPLQEK